MHCNAHEDGRFYLARFGDIYFGGDYVKYAQGCRRDTYYENICKSLPSPRSHRCWILSLRFIVSGDFFPLTIAVPSCGPLRHSRRSHSSFFTGRAASHRIYGTYGGRYVLWLIVLLSLTYFQFTAAARHFASWLSIVRDERRFMCHPGLYFGLRPARVLFARCSSHRIW